MSDSELDHYRRWLRAEQASVLAEAELRVQIKFDEIKMHRQLSLGPTVAGRPKPKLDSRT